MTYATDATGPFYHGTRADLVPGDLLAPGHASNYADRKLSWITFSGHARRGDLGLRAGQGWPSPLQGRGLGEGAGRSTGAHR